MKKILPVVNLIAFILMIYVNYLSGVGKINDISAGGVSAEYPTLFTPAGFTFSMFSLTTWMPSGEALSILLITSTSEVRNTTSPG